MALQAMQSGVLCVCYCLWLHFIWKAKKLSCKLLLLLLSKVSNDKGQVMPNRPLNSCKESSDLAFTHPIWPLVSSHRLLCQSLLLLRFSKQAEHACEHEHYVCSFLAYHLGCKPYKTLLMMKGSASANGGTLCVQCWAMLVIPRLDGVLLWMSASALLFYIAKKKEHSGFYRHVTSPPVLMHLEDFSLIQMAGPATHSSCTNTVAFSICAEVIFMCSTHHLS